MEVRENFTRQQVFFKGHDFRIGIVPCLLEDFGGTVGAAFDKGRIVRLVGMVIFEIG